MEKVRRKCGESGEWGESEEKVGRKWGGNGVCIGAFWCDKQEFSNDDLVFFYDKRAFRMTGVTLSLFASGQERSPVRQTANIAKQAAGRAGNRKSL